MNIINTKIAILFLITPSLLLSVNNAYANTCTAVAGSYTVNSPAIIVQRDTPVGSPISNVIYGSQSKAYTCTADGSDGTSAGVKSGVLEYDSSGGSDYKIYKTNIPGVGVSIGVKAHSTGGASTFDAEYSVGGPEGSTNGASGENYNMQSWTTNKGDTDAYYFAPRIQFFKIGKITSGILTGQYGTFIANSKMHSAGTWAKEIPTSFGNITITQVACSITTPTMTFPIGNVPASDFGNKVGFIPTKTSTQNLGLDCDADANINVKLSGTQNPDVSTKSVLALNGQGDAGTASGVGVQLLYNGTPLEINKNIVMKKSSGGQEMLPITARYYQTKTAVTAGDASTSATLALTYQ